VIHEDRNIIGMTPVTEPLVGVFIITDPDTGTAERWQYPVVAWGIQFTQTTRRDVDEQSGEQRVVPLFWDAGEQAVLALNEMLEPSNVEFERLESGSIASTLIEDVRRIEQA
jgi:hypothetical protein